MSDDTSAPISGLPSQPQQPTRPEPEQLPQQPVQPQGPQEPPPWEGWLSPTQSVTPAQPVIPPQPPIPPQPVAPPPGYQPASNPQPGPQQHGYQQPGYPPPGYEQLSNQQPGYQQANNPRPAYQQPGYPPPGYQQPGYPPPPVTPPPPRARRRPPLWLLVTAGVVVAGLVAGLLVWAPWSPPPQQPTAVRVTSPTATTALVQWAAPKGGAAPAQYNILRDGKEQGIVPASQTSWRDTGLAPGSRHTYSVETVGNGQQSAPTAIETLTTITPPPVNVTATDVTHTTVTLHWTPSPDAPTPDAYHVYDTSTGQTLLASEAAGQTSYTVTKLNPGDSDTFAVTATWGTAVSALSQVANVQPLDVPLDGPVPVTLKFTKIPAGSTGVNVGLTGDTTWTFTSNCQAASCTLTDKGNLTSGVGAFTAKLTPDGAGYKGTATHVEFSHCAGANTFNKAVIQIDPNTGGVHNGAWGGWHGTMVIESPMQTVGSEFCDAGNWDLNLTGTGS